MVLKNILCMLYFVNLSVAQSIICDIFHVIMMKRLIKNFHQIFVNISWAMKWGCVCFLVYLGNCLGSALDWGHPSLWDKSAACHPNPIIIYTLHIVTTNNCDNQTSGLLYMYLVEFRGELELVSGSWLLVTTTWWVWEFRSFQFVFGEIIIIS